MPIEEKNGARLGRRVLGWTLQGLGLLIVVFLIHLWQTRDLVEGAAPTLIAETLQGELFDLEGQAEWPLLVHFWASWCPVCRLESDTIQAVSKDYPVVTVAMQSGSKSDISNYLKKNQLQFPVINDPTGDLSMAWHVRGLPTSYIIGSDGEIRFVSVGYTPQILLRMRLWLAKVWT
ncbi:MAG: protein disulfide oxidoreductase [Candidatus Thiodiazotropha sp. (ex Lucinoma annulata)]|nr:protein disulfide oxidoreductase [Candidatus Thiodiazotropha sp. (ex Lucinoma annulata)]